MEYNIQTSDLIIPNTDISNNLYIYLYIYIYRYTSIYLYTDILKAQKWLLLVYSNGHQLTHSSLCCIDSIVIIIVTAIAIVLLQRRHFLFGRQRPSFRCFYEHNNFPHRCLNHGELVVSDLQSGVLFLENKTKKVERFFSSEDLSG